MDICQPNDQVWVCPGDILYVGTKKGTADDRKAFGLRTKKGRVLPECIVDCNRIEFQCCQDIFTDSDQANNTARLFRQGDGRIGRISKSEVICCPVRLAGRGWTSTCDKKCHDEQNGKDPGETEHADALLLAR